MQMEMFPHRKDTTAALLCVCAHLLRLFDRLKEELEEKDERLLSCQRRCDIMQEQLSSDCAAGEEAARLREDVEKVQQEARELRRERL